jgi:hypothetical protein
VTFELALEVVRTAKMPFQVSVFPSLVEGDRKRQWGTTLLLSPGQTITLGGVRDVVLPARNKMLGDLAGLVAAKKPASLKIIMPIVSMDKPDRATVAPDGNSVERFRGAHRMN